MGLENIGEFPNIVRWLVKHGYSDDEIAKAIGGNTLRVLGAGLDRLTRVGPQQRARILSCRSRCDGGAARAAPFPAVADTSGMPAPVRALVA